MKKLFSFLLIFTMCLAVNVGNCKSFDNHSCKSEVSCSIGDLNDIISPSLLAFEVNDYVIIPINFGPDYKNFRLNSDYISRAKVENGIYKPDRSDTGNLNYSLINQKERFNYLNIKSHWINSKEILC